jgi:predicted transcriptional regulator
LSFGKKKIKIEMEDAEGGKYNLSLEGNISKNKVMKVFEMMELLDVKGHNDGQGRYDNIEQHKDYSSSMGAKIWRIIEKKFQFSSFTSSDVLRYYRDEYGATLQLSIISTYLSRYSDKGKIERAKKGKEWIYKVLRNPQQMESQRSDYRPLFQEPQLSSDIRSTDVN